MRNVTKLKGNKLAAVWSIDIERKKIVFLRFVMCPLLAPHF